MTPTNPYGTLQRQDIVISYRGTTGIVEWLTDRRFRRKPVTSI